MHILIGNEHRLCRMFLVRQIGQIFKIPPLPRVTRGMVMLGIKRGIMCIPIKDVHYQWVTSPFTVSHIPIHSEAHPQFQWGCAFAVSYISISDEASLGMHILTRNGHVAHWKWWCGSPWMKMCLTGNAHLHRILRMQQVSSVFKTISKWSSGWWGISYLCTNLSDGQFFYY